MTQVDDINRKLQAAQILGMTIEEEFKVIEGNLFVMITIKTGEDISIPIPIKKEEVIRKLNNEKENMNGRLKKIGMALEKVKGMKC